MIKNQIYRVEKYYNNKKYQLGIQTNMDRELKKKIQEVIKTIYLDLIYEKIGGLLNKSAHDVIDLCMKNTVT